MKYIPKEITEEVNVSKTHPLVNITYLLITVIGVSCLAFLGLGVLANTIAEKIDLTTEEKIGKLLTEEIREENVIKDDPRLPYVSKLAQSLYQQNNHDQEKLNLKVHILDESMMNAMVMPGGYIFVTKGLLDEVETENELSFVLAHEIAHIENGDSKKALGRSLVFLFVATIFNIGGNNQSHSQMVWLTGNLTSLSYSRTQEERADREAMITMIEYYGHGEDSLEFFEKIHEHIPSEISENKLSEYFSTHPLTLDRIDTLEDLAKKNNLQMTGELTPLPPEFKQSQ